MTIANVERIMTLKLTVKVESIHRQFPRLVLVTNKHYIVMALKPIQISEIIIQLLLNRLNTKFLYRKVHNIKRCQSIIGWMDFFLIF